MNFNEHSDLKGTHAIFGASQSAWLRYDLDKMVDRVRGEYRKEIGTMLHAFASIEIELGHKKTTAKSVKEGLETYIYNKFYLEEYDRVSDFGKRLLRGIKYLPHDIFETTKVYINDGIGFRMLTEKPLVYSDYFFGTADAISFRDNFLRIHDLKTGSIPAHIEQLEIYAALFCLEYKIKPKDISIELRIYQNTEVLIHSPEAEDIFEIMEKMMSSNKVLERLEQEEE